MPAYESLRSKAASIDLSARGKIRVTGEDRARLLHAMSTNHISGLKPGDGVYAFFLTAQGRTIADSYIYNLGPSLFVDTEPEIGQKLLEHLDRFIIADDAEVHDETEDWSAIGIEGPESLQIASQLGFPIPGTEFGILDWNNGFVARVSSTGSAGLRVFVPKFGAPALKAKLRDSGLSEATSSDAEAVRLENGIPRYGTDIDERRLVQETGLEHGVHPNKGCYVGQEIVERVRSRAQLHRQLRRILIPGSEVPPPGTKLRIAGNDVGEVTSAAFSPSRGSVVGLAYIRTERVHPGSEFDLAGFDPEIKAQLG